MSEAWGVLSCWVGGLAARHPEPPLTRPLRLRSLASGNPKSIDGKSVPGSFVCPVSMEIMVGCCGLGRGHFSGSGGGPWTGGLGTLGMGSGGFCSYRDRVWHLFKEYAADPALALCPLPPPPLLPLFAAPLFPRQADPVILATGHTYDRASIERWLEQGHRPARSPACGCATWS